MPSPAAIARSGVRSSSIQIERPCVPAIRSLPLISISWIGETGRLSWRRCQLAAVVEREVDAGLGAGIEQALLRGIGADHAGEIVVGDALR